MDRDIKGTFIKYVALNVLGMAGLSCYILADTFFIARAMGAEGLAALNFSISIYSIIHGIGLMRRHRRSDKILHTEGPLQTQKGRYSLCRIVQAGPLCGHHTCGDRPVRIISTGINAWRRQFDTANDNDISEDDTVLCPILHIKQYTDCLRTQRQRTQAFDGSNARRKSFQVLHRFFLCRDQRYRGHVLQRMRKFRLRIHHFHRKRMHRHSSPLDSSEQTDGHDRSMALFRHN